MTQPTKCEPKKTPNTNNGGTGGVIDTKMIINHNPDGTVTKTIKKTTNLQQQQQNKNRNFILSHYSCLGITKLNHNEYSKTSGRPICYGVEKRLFQSPILQKEEFRAILNKASNVKQQREEKKRVPTSFDNNGSDNMQNDDNSSSIPTALQALAIIKKKNVTDKEVNDDKGSNMRVSK